jgi:hypothetical protein
MSDDYTLEKLKAEVERLDERLFYGCGNHGCRVNPPTGLATNGACNCTPKEFSMVLLEIAIRLDQMGPGWKRESIS